MINKFLLLGIVLIQLTVYSQIYDSSANQKFKKDTLVVKSIDNNEKNGISVIFPYLIGLLGIAGTFYTVHKTIRHQREIAQAQIISETKKKWIEDIRKISAQFNSISAKIHQFLLVDTDKGNKLEEEDKQSINKLFYKLESFACSLEMYLSPKISGQEKLRNDIRHMLTKLSIYFNKVDGKSESIETIDLALDILELSAAITENFRELISDEENNIDKLLSTHTLLQNIKIFWNTFRTFIESRST
ncbi:MAG: hypothetical protein P4L45_09755 [Ignavibacteriaceae bacterium]|nr:hypothetical protein [Ignavibacteriaceae bacterium]